MITFRRVTADDFPLIGRWLDQPHVKRWWAHETDPEAVARDFGPTLRGEEPSEDLVAELDGVPLGLAQRCFWHAYPDELAEFAPYVDIPAAAMTIDYLVGAPEDVGHGKGTAMIAALVADTFEAHPGATALVVPVAAGNTASWRVLEKAGFRFVATAQATPDNPADPRDQRVYRLDRPAPPNPWLAMTGGTGGPRYTERFAALAAQGQDLHGEARRVDGLLDGPADVLDAGCGTGRVAIRLAELGHRVVGVDLDASMLGEARRAAPDLEWHLADLTELALARDFDLVVAAGNLWPLLTPGTHAAVTARLAGHLRPGGILITGFGLDADHTPFTLPEDVGYPTLAEYDDAAAAVGLTLEQRTADWDGLEPYTGGGYAVSVHRAGTAGRAEPPRREHACGDEGAARVLPWRGR